MAKKKETKKKKYDPIAYTKSKKPTKYKSKYSEQMKSARKEMKTARKEMAAARQNLANFKYDPMQDANYQAMAQIYGQRGNIAAQDTLGDAASLNGGFGTSYAVSAAQQARNQYNEELAALVPEFEQNAYNRMATNYGLLQDSYGLLQDNYKMYKDLDTEAYERYRDKVADYQWGKGYDTDVYQQKQADALALEQWKFANGLPNSYGEKGSGGSSGGGGGGRRRRSGGGGGGYSGGGTSAATDDFLRKTYEKTAQSLNKKAAQGPSPNVPQTIAAVGKSVAYQTQKKKKK